MWSKRAETRKHSMTSFRNKITRRKRKYTKGSSSGSNNNIQFLARRLLVDNRILDENTSVAVTPFINCSNKMKAPKRVAVQDEVDTAATIAIAAVNCGQTAEHSNLTLNSGSTKERINEVNLSLISNSENDINWPTDSDAMACVECATDNNCGDEHVIGSEMKCGTNTATNTSFRYSHNYEASKNNRSIGKSLLRTRSGQLSKTDNQFYDKRCDVIRNVHVNATLCRHRIVPGEYPTKECPPVVSNDNTAMQYSKRVNDSADKHQQQKSASENRRSMKNKKKHDKSKQCDIDMNNDDAQLRTTNNITTGIDGVHANTIDSKSRNKTKKTSKPETDNSTSYLKRVKSKIYKSRSDSSASVTSTDAQPMTNKTKTKKVKEKKSPDKSHSKIPKICEDVFEDDFFEDVHLRKTGLPLFLRQSSNLERVRPKTFGLRTSASNIGISDLVDSTTNILHVPVEKPILIKSKSSSAINLNLLRNRRSKIQDHNKKSCKNAETEFNFIAYGALNTNVTINRKFCTNNPPVINNRIERPTSWLFGNSLHEGDRQPGQPVSRSSSDKRPDAVTEEIPRASDRCDPENDADVTHDNVHIVQRAKSSQPAINRSESYKEQSQKRRQIRERRKISDPNLSKSTDVDSDHQELSYHSGSSSNSSLSSSRSSESPQSTSLDTVPGTHPHANTTTSTTAWDSDVDIEPDPPDWQSSVSEEILSRLHPEEKKRQEIINELFHTERSHVRNLRVLETVFYRPLLHNKCLPPDQVRLLFPNLEEMLEIHGKFNLTMKTRRKEEAVIGDIGELLLNMFDGPAGENFQEAAAKFCARQQLALESLKEKRRKDPRLNAFLSDSESDKLCKRLQLKDIIPTGMQRLVKYPLLFESLARCTERVLDSTMTESLPSSSPTVVPPIPQVGPTPTELVRLKRAVERSKEILNYVNQSVKDAEDKSRLQDMQKKLDKSSFEKYEHPISVEFRHLDLTKHNLIHEGPLVWRLNKQNKLHVHVVLLEEVILLLHKQDEKYVLKFVSCVGVVHSPIVKVSTVLVRHNATEKDSLYLVNTAQNGAQIYDLSLQSASECKTWFKHISDAAEAYKSREGKSRRSELSTPEPEGIETCTADLAAAGTTNDNDGDKLTTDPMNASISGDQASSSTGDVHSNADTDSTAPSGESSQRNSSVIDDDTTEKRLSQADSDNASATSIGSDGSGAIGNSKREAQMRLATEDQPLIQPSEVMVNVLPVHTAQPVITPIEQVRRKDEAIRQALAEKEALVAEILHVPPEDYHTIVDMAGDVSGDKEPTELVLAAVHQANQLWSIVSESLNISDADAVLATRSLTTTLHPPPPCASVQMKQTLAAAALPSIPSHSVQNIASTLNIQLTALLKVVKEREEERERMRRELQKLREQVHVMHEAHLKTPGSLCTAAPDSEIFHSAGDLANIEEDS